MHPLVSDTPDAWISVAACCHCGHVAFGGSACQERVQDDNGAGEGGPDQGHHQAQLEGRAAAGRVTTSLSYVSEGATGDFQVHIWLSPSAIAVRGGTLSTAQDAVGAAVGSQD